MDFTSLAKMKLDAARNPEKTVDKVAEQFESIFINMMLQSMRKATERSGLMDSDAAQTYESMFDQELALHLSEQGGFGVAEALERQMQMNQSRKRVTAPDGLPLKGDIPNGSMRLSQGTDTYTLDRKPANSARTLER